MSKIVAVIDIGSNSARMAIFKKSSRFGFHLIKEARSRVRISEDTYENEGHLQPLPMLRAIKALKEFKLIAKALDARKILCVATSAVRDAPNRAEFLSMTKKETGLSIKVIAGEEEALFGGIAALNLLPINEGITIDIGGGSTECAYIKDGKIASLNSLNIGTIRLKELFYDKKESVDKAREFIKKEIDKLPLEIDTATAIGIGGTIRALSKSIMKSSKYPIDLLHGYSIDTTEYIKIFDDIAESPIMKLKKFNIKEDRLDTIREGALIYSEILKKYSIKSVMTSGVGVREGVFLKDLLRNSNFKFPVNFNPSVRSLVDRFCFTPRIAAFQQKILSKLFDTLEPLHKIDDSYKQHLNTAIKLIDIGVALNYYSHHKHSGYFLLNSLNYGFSHEDRTLIAILVEYHNKKLPSESTIDGYEKLLPNIETIQWLSFLITLADALNSNMANTPMEFRYENMTLYVKSKIELYLAKEAIKKLTKPKPIGIKFEIEE